MKTLFQNIKAGLVTKQACESQLTKFKQARTEAGRDANLDLSIDLLQCIVDNFDNIQKGENK